VALDRRRAKGRANKGSFISVPHTILEHDNYASLSARAVKLLIDLFAQFRGSNNGDLAAAWKLMEKRGWRSKETLHRAKRELLDKARMQSVCGHLACNRRVRREAGHCTYTRCIGLLEAGKQPGSIIRAPYTDHIGPITVPIRVKTATY
jgi:hypothetical protein